MGRYLLWQGSQGGADLHGNAVQVVASLSESPTAMHARPSMLDITAWWTSMVEMVPV